MDIRRRRGGPSPVVGASYLADPSVAGLVYVAAHMPDAGENEGDDGKRFWADGGQSGSNPETTYSMTLFKLNASYSMVVGGDRLIAAWGRCEPKKSVLVEAAKLGPRLSPDLALVYEAEKQKGHANRATIAVARKLVAICSPSTAAAESS
jgi:hypothetical protein